MERTSAHLFSRPRTVVGVGLLVAAGIAAGWWLLRDRDGGDGDRIPEFLLREVSVESGLRFEHFGGTRSGQLPEDMGSGAAWIDYNDDGWPDLFVANIAGPLTASPAEIRSSTAHCALFRNDGDGTFAEVSEEAGLDVRGWINGVARADFDNDGHTDLVLTAYGRNRLFRNRGEGRFEEVTGEAGLEEREGYWMGATWGDYDRDGWVDLYVTGYVRYDSSGGGAGRRRRGLEIDRRLNPYAFPPHRNLLYHNDGDGTFTEVSEEAGVRNASGKGLGAAWADFTGDGWPDLYVANDVSENALYRNERDGTFSEIARLSGVADHRGSMGLGVGDFDHDRDLDLYITHWVKEANAFYVNLGRPRGSDSGPEPAVQFLDQAGRYGLAHPTRPLVGWGTSFFDYDNDRNLDLFVTNGSTREREDDPTRLRAEPDLLFWRPFGSGRYFDVRELSEGEPLVRDAAGDPLPEDEVGRGAAFADYDRDGDVDVFVVNHGARGWLLENGQETSHHWIELRLEGRASNRSAIGARIRLHADTLVQTREVGAQSSYLSDGDLAQHFGLGGEGRIDSVEIAWPSGRTQLIRDLPVDTVLTVIEAAEVSSRWKGREEPGLAD